jgi:hypothetical protein
MAFRKADALADNPEAAKEAKAAKAAYARAFRAR